MGPDMQKPTCPTATFLSLWAFIAFVSVHDGFLMAIYRDAHRTSDLEQNPFADSIIRLGDQGIWVMLALKACGTVLACALLLLLYVTWRRGAWIVTWVVAALQATLLLYLYFS